MLSGSVPPAVTLPRIDMMPIWHERTHSDQLRRWLRLKIHQHTQAIAESRTMLDMSSY